MFKLKVTEEMGRGLYATRYINPGEIIMTCEVLVLSQDDTVKVNATDLKYYTFVFNETQDCLVLGLGEIFNHDDKANVSYQLQDFEGRKVMVFKSKEVICPDDQLMIDYSQDIKVNSTSYIETKSLVG